MEKRGAEKNDLSRTTNQRPKRKAATHDERKSESQDSAKDRGEELKVPPDGGWGWLVASGSFIICMIDLMIIPCFGVLFSPFLLETGTSSTTIAWIFNIQTFILYLMGVIVSALSKEFGWRKVGVLGCALASTAVISSAFAPVAEFLFFSFSFLSGVGVGLAVCMCFIIVPIYFDRRRGMANAIMMAGICMGEVLGPPVIRYLQDEYGFKGATLILGAIALNGCVGACFFHPVEWHMKKPSTEEAPEASGVSLPLIREDQAEMEVNSAGIDATKAPRDFDKIPSVLSFGFRKTHSGVSLSNPTAGQELDTGTPSAKLTRVRRLRQVSECSLNSGHSFHNSTLSLSSSVLFGPTVILPNRGMDETVSVEDEAGVTAVTRSVLRVLRSTVSDIKILRHRRAIIIAIASTLFCNGYFNFIMMVPFAMQAADFTLQDSALCISVAAIFNLVFRFLMSMMSDWPWFNLRAAFLGGHITLTSAMIVFPFMVDLRLTLATMGLLGCGVGTCLSLNPLVVIDIMGLDNLPKSFAVSSLVTGVGFVTSGPLIGLMRDLSGSYAASMLTCSALIFSSFLLWLGIPLATACDKRSSSKVDEKVTNEDQEEV